MQDDYKNIDAELTVALDKMTAVFGTTSFDTGDISLMREMHNQSALRNTQPDEVNEQIEHWKESIPRAESETTELRLYKPRATDAQEGQTEKLPCIVFVHGGGYISGRPWHAHERIQRLVLDHQCMVAAVEYGLAPEKPFPAGLNDCVAAIDYLFENGERLNLDESRTVLLGESAGGGLAAGVSLFLRDRGSSLFAGQILIYPMIDRHNVDVGGEDFHIWSRRNNRDAWQAYLSGEFDQDQIAYAAAIEAENFSGLPSTTILTGEQDLFIEENKTLHSRFINDGVESTFVTYPGAYHGFAHLAPEANVSKKYQRDLDNAISKLIS